MVTSASFNASATSPPQEDIIASLTARLDLLVEDAERADEDAAEDPVMGGGSGAQQARPALLAPVAAGQTALLQMPRRIAVPWIHGALSAPCNFTNAHWLQPAPLCSRAGA